MKNAVLMSDFGRKCDVDSGGVMLFIVFDVTAHEVEIVYVSEVSDDVVIEDCETCMCKAVGV